MSAEARILIVVIGLGVALYGFVPLMDSSKAPDWWFEGPPAELPQAPPEYPDMFRGTIRAIDPRAGSESISAAIGIVGIAGMACGLWPRDRRRSRAPT